MNHGSLFSGIGGFDLAAQWMGWNNIFHCEWMPFPQKVLKHYWPNAISYHDITKTDFTIHRGTIEILTGGFPCQPYSQAGKRRGKDDERHLWPEMLRAIREIQPRWVVGENVYGLVNWNGGMVFEEVCFDLENCGYQVQPVLLPSCSIGAPHRRDRIFFIAHTDNIRFNGCIGKDEINTSQRGVNAFDDIKSIGNANVANTKRKGFYGLHETRGKDIINRENTKIRGGFTGYYQANYWNKFPTVPPVCGGNDGIPNRLDGITFSKWRQESIKGYGNAVVPQLVYQIFKTIELYEQRNI